MKTYISLFSSAGVGCYGFKLEGFDCVATNELILRRLDIQRANKKCKYDSGYICGDISDISTKKALDDAIEFWEQNESLTRLDVVIATPPCQGMSVANHKKSDTEILRNSLVVESIKFIKKHKPRFFIFENVPAFMKTICTDVDGVDKSIADAICNNLGSEYSYTSKILNFKNHGACSSRSRTLVIGVSRDLADEVSPYELYPDYVAPQTLWEAIGELRSFDHMGDIDSNDIYHFFRRYPEHMRAWIHDLDEGQSAFDNSDDAKKPHRIIDGKVVINKQKNGDKYKRQCWDKNGPCVHTRNDQLASQNTIHPRDDRVFSIRELMVMMAVPDSFKWSFDDVGVLNAAPENEKRAFLKKEEIKIRQSLGEAVPTIIFQNIARKISATLSVPHLRVHELKKIAADEAFQNADKLLAFIKDNPQGLSTAALGKVAELANSRRTDHAAFYTNKSLITEMLKSIPDIDKDEIRILEPSVGVGNFIPQIINRFEGKKIIIDAVDIDPTSIEICKVLLSKYPIPTSCTINYIVDDFLTHDFSESYDYVIGNPPFFKLKQGDQRLPLYQRDAINKESANLCSFFFDKASALSAYLAIVFPKSILNTPEFNKTREYFSHKAFNAIIDFGEKGFPGVLIETVALILSMNSKPGHTRVFSLSTGESLLQRQSYIFDEAFPYWIIYRNADFDKVCSKMEFGQFTVFRDRQITNQLLSANDGIRVLKSRNIDDDGSGISDIAGYDAYVAPEVAQRLRVFDFLNRADVYLTPNMTLKPRVIKKPVGVLVNGSVAILIPAGGLILSDGQMKYYSSEEFRSFYRIARNYQTRSLNIDACSVFFFGVLNKGKEGEK